MFLFKTLPVCVRECNANSLLCATNLLLSAISNLSPSRSGCISLSSRYCVFPSSMSIGNQSKSVPLCFKSNDTHIWSRLSFLLSRCNAWQLRNQQTTHARSLVAIIKWSKLQVVSSLGEKQKSEQNTRAHFPCVACPPILVILTKGKTWIIIWPLWSISLISRFCVSLPNQRTTNYNFVRNKTLQAFIV